jgi:hypothetical protein
MGKKIIRLTESDLIRLVKRVINEAKGDTQCDLFFKKIFAEKLANSKNGWDCTFRDYDTIACKHKQMIPFVIEKYCGDSDYGFKIYNGDGVLSKELVNKSTSEQVVDRCITFLDGFLTYEKKFNG